MTEYSWPDWGDYRDREAVAQRAWSATVAALTLGTRITATVIGRQPFGVFLLVDGHPDAIGLAEIFAIPNATLPEVGERVRGAVIWHAEHNHQIRVKLDP